MNEPRLKLETQDGAIVISLPGTSYRVTFEGLPDGQALSASHSIEDDKDAPITSVTIAKDKARELGWIV